MKPNTVKKKPKVDAFAKQMDAIGRLAKAQGCRTKREVAMYVIGYYFGWGDGISGKVRK